MKYRTWYGYWYLWQCSPNSNHCTFSTMCYSSVPVRTGWPGPVSFESPDGPSPPHHGETAQPVPAPSEQSPSCASGPTPPPPAASYFSPAGRYCGCSSFGPPDLWALCSSARAGRSETLPSAAASEDHPAETEDSFRAKTNSWHEK